MSGPENTFIASVHRLLPKDLYRMKNHNQYNGGIADVWYSGMKADLWVEYKFITLPKRDDTVIDLGLSPLQHAWLMARHREGRAVAVIVGSKTGGLWLPGSNWTEEITVADFNRRSRTRIELAEWIVDSCSN